MSGNYNCFVISCFFFFIVSNTNMSGNYNLDMWFGECTLTREIGKGISM